MFSAIICFIFRKSNQIPLMADLLQCAQQKLPEIHHLLDGVALG